MEKLKEITGTKFNWTCSDRGEQMSLPVRIFKKKDGDLSICGDYKFGVKYKIYANSYPIHSIEWGLNSPASMKTFSKTDFKTACHQID